MTAEQARTIGAEVAFRKERFGRIWMNAGTLLAFRLLRRSGTLGGGYERHAYKFARRKLLHEDEDVQTKPQQQDQRTHFLSMHIEHLYRTIKGRMMIRQRETS